MEIFPKFCPRKLLLFYLMLKSDYMNNSKSDKTSHQRVLSKVRIELQLIRRTEEMVFLLPQCLQRKVLYHRTLN